ncbi:MAG: CBS domain-containing protein [Chlorobi bacterium]|nr:MAG: chloride channel protein [Bacteroidota bacterium]MBE2266040.1 chloride channel protein [Flavobacteriales bacterium]MBL1161866.1 CBS domain-containing protein [Chlorobiota bacterium]MBW7854352.1 chloride channel protein [Candidatus Kapabacteria bacterium]MCC6330683.1 chloride channel protein [Ignavibacteria bacterium]
MTGTVLRYIILFNRWRKERISQTTFLLIAAAVVGVLGGAAASVIKKATHLVAESLQNEIAGTYKYALYFVLPILGLILTTGYVKIFLRKQVFKQGIVPIIRNILYNRSRVDFHNSYSQIITSALTVGMGGSVGLESPSVASGAALGSNVGRLFGLSYRDTTLLLACGGAAGISGAFDSPIAGMLFALEVLLPSFSIPAITPLLIASAVASVISWMVYNQPLFVYVADSWTQDGFWIYILFGILSGAYTVYYASANERINTWLGGIKRTWVRIAVGGISLGTMIALFPALYGEGYINIQPLLDGNYTSLIANSMFSAYREYAWVLIAYATLTVIAKTVACSVTLSAGGNGGMFGPSVVIGGLLGFIFSYGLNQTGLTDVNVTHFIVAGMAASISGVMHAPLTGIFLSAEITGGYSLMVPLMMVSAISYFINKHFRKYSIYTKPIALQGNDYKDEVDDNRILSGLTVREVLDHGFVTLFADETVESRRTDIMQSARSVFPVTNRNGKLVGTLGIEHLMESLLHTPDSKSHQTVAEIVQPVKNVVNITMPMSEVMQHMDKLGRHFLPVVDDDGMYCGYVTKDSVFTAYRQRLNEKLTV